MIPSNAFFIIDTMERFSYNKIEDLLTTNIRGLFCVSFYFIIQHSLEISEYERRVCMHLYYIEPF